MVQTFKTTSHTAQEIIHKKIQDQGTQVPFFKKIKQSWRIQKTTQLRYAHSFESPWAKFSTEQLKSPLQTVH